MNDESLYLHSIECDCEECLEKWKNVYLINGIPQELKPEKIKIIPADPKDQEIANQLSALINWKNQEG